MSVQGPSPRVSGVVVGDEVSVEVMDDVGVVVADDVKLEVGDDVVVPDVVEVELGLDVAVVLRGGHVGIYRPVRKWPAIDINVLAYRAQSSSSPATNLR